MGAKYTKAQKTASETYMRDKHTIRVVVTEEKAQQYKDAAEKEGKSLNRFMIDCAEEHLACINSSSTAERNDKQ